MLELKIFIFGQLCLLESSLKFFLKCHYNILKKKDLFFKMSFYLFIFILCAKILCVTLALGPIQTRYFCTQYCEPRISMMNQGKLLTKLNPRYVKVFKSLPWLDIELYASKISMSFYHFIAILCAKISSVYKPLPR